MSWLDLQRQIDELFDWDEDDERRLMALSCAHTETTFTDENEDAICMRCGAVIQKRFNMERFKAQLRRLGEG